VTVLASAYTFLSPVASAMIAPATPNIAAEFDIRSSVEIVLTVSIFVLAYGIEHIASVTLISDGLKYLAFGPLLFAPLSEIYGRVRLLQSTNILFLGE
jgi:MFS family permease